MAGPALKSKGDCDKDCAAKERPGLNNLSIREQNRLAAWARRMRRRRKRWFNIEAICAASSAENYVAGCYADQEVAVLRSPRGHCIIHPSAKHPGKYQVTYCNDSGFLSDSTFDSIRAAVKQCLIEGYRVRLEQKDAEALMLATVEAEAQYQLNFRTNRNNTSHSLEP